MEYEMRDFRLEHMTGIYSSICGNVKYPVCFFIFVAT